MTDTPIEMPGQDNSDGDQGNQEGQPDFTVNPAWNEALGVIPSDLHSQVVPHFQKWDQNFQTQIQKVQSEYEPYKPFIDGGYAPEDIEFGLGLIQQLTSNPTEVIQALQAWVSEGEEGTTDQGQNGSTPQQNLNPEFDITQNPAFQQQEQAVRAMAEILMEQRRMEQEAAADQELDNELSTLADKYKDRGEFDIDFVMGVALNSPNGGDSAELEAAVEKYYAIQDKALQQQRRPGPPVLGSGGAIPNGRVDTSKLDGKERRAYVQQMLEQANQNT